MNIMLRSVRLENCQCKKFVINKDKEEKNFYAMMVLTTAGGKNG